MPDIYEDRQDQQGVETIISELNTPEQIKRGEYYRQRYFIMDGEMKAREAEWDVIERQYKAHREVDDDDDPNSFIPIVTPIIEGQVASMLEKNISANVKGKELADQNFARTGQILTDFALQGIKIKQIIKDGIRRYLLFGTGIFAYGWDPDALDEFGMPESRTPQLTRIYVDGRIKDVKDYQKAEFIIEEIGFQSIDWARKRYSKMYGDKKGNDIADCLLRLNNQYPFDSEINFEDRNSTAVLFIWTRNNKYGSLQLIEMDKRGFIMAESDPKTPYFQYVKNRYPFSFFGLYPEEGHFYRFGDGKLLYRVQDTINKLYDEIVTACKFSAQARTYVDPAAQMDPDDHDNDPSHIIVAKNPNTNIKCQQGQGLNQVVFELVHDLLQQARQITRFDTIMSGQAPQREITATQVGVQMQQGNSGINDKRADVSQAITEMVEYFLGMMMELWPTGKALRITGDQMDKFEWVDPRELLEVPVLIPIDNKYRDKWKKENPDQDYSLMPSYMQLEGKEENGEGKTVVIPKTRMASLDININIGEGLPTSKIALYNIIIALAQLQVVDESTGMPRPLIGYQQVKNMIEDLVGLPLEEIPMKPPAPPQGQPQGQGTPQQNVPPVNMNENIPGANMAGQQQGVPVHGL